MTARVAVLMGGTESEHDISLLSGAEVLRHLPADRYDASGVTWRRDGRFEFGSDGEPLTPDLALARLGEADVVFLALHGPGGEDGRIQGFLETAGIPYTGSGVLASALAMDKVAAKSLARQGGVPVAAHTVVEGADALAPGFPCIVKPVGAGSSAGLRIADDERGFTAAVADLLPRWPSLLVEEFVSGVEVTGPVLEDPVSGIPGALPLVEIRHAGRRVFDYEAKYLPGAAEEICPAPIDDAPAERVREASLVMHRTLGCRGVSRSDFILRDGIPVYLETNTIPGLTRASLLPRAARAAGLSMGELLDGIVRCALRTREAK